jgi:hypothetical protein
MIEPALRTILTASTDVGALAPGGVHIEIAPQDERRARVIIDSAVEEPQNDHDGPAGWSQGSVEVVCFAPTKKAARLLAAAVNAAVQAFNAAPEPAADVNVQFLETTTLQSIPGNLSDGRESPTFGVSLDVDYLIFEE